jgi:hypothetical protein
VDLATGFENNNTVVLLTTVQSVYGLVPPGKTLVVLGDYTKISNGKTLNVAGTLDMFAEMAVLDASAIFKDGSGKGALWAASTALIKGPGALILPYNLDEEGAFDAVDGEGFERVHFNSALLSAAGSPPRFPGSVFYNGPADINYPALGSSESPQPLIPDFLEPIYLKENVGELTVYNIENLTAKAISNNRKLILRGEGNTIIGKNLDDSGDFKLAGTSTLVIANGGKLSVNSEVLGRVTLTTSETSNIIVNEGGAIDLKVPHRIERGTGNSFENNGTILFDPDLPEGVKDLIGLRGTGTVVLKPYVPLSLGRWPLRQNLVIEEGDISPDSTGTDSNPFDGIDAGKTITIGHSGTLRLEARHTISAKIVNNGTLVTKTGWDYILKDLWEKMDNTGRVDVEGDLGKRSSDDVGLKADFVIPAGIELHLGSNAKLMSKPGEKYNVIINGALILDGAHLTPAKDVVVNGYFDINNGSLIVDGGVMTVEGALDTGSTLTSGIGDAALLIKKGSALVIANPETVTGGDAAVNAGEIKVEDKAALKIAGEEGYSTNNAVRGSDFAEAVEAIKSSTNALVPAVALGPDSPYNGTGNELLVVGTVIINDGTNPYPIAAVAGTVVDYPAYYIPVSPSIYTIQTEPLVDKGITVVTHTDGIPVGAFFKSADDFEVSAAGYISIKDLGYQAGGGDQFGVILFNSIRLVKDGLLSPVVPEFMVGVKSRRS